MWRISIETSAVQLTTSVKLPQALPFSSQTLSADLIVVVCNIADTIYLVQHELLLHTIFFDEVLEHLLSTKRNFHVIHWLDKFLLHISLVDMLSSTNIFSKWVVGSSSNVQHISHRRSEKLRVT
jgi:hypothetical protein